MSSGVGTKSERAAGLVLKFRRLFFKMSSREKLLAVLFASALVFVWFSTQWDRHIAVGDTTATANDEADFQQSELNRESSIQAQYDLLISQINLEELPSKEEVSSRIDTMLRRYGFGSFDLGQAKTEEGTDLRFHTIPLDVKKATFAQVRTFTEEFKKELPYISLERIIIRPQARDDQFVDVNYILKVIEYAK